nr:MAG TPA: hypothetical protein [Caudoviricetes sp.]
MAGYLLYMRSWSNAPACYQYCRVRLYGRR